MSNEEEIIENPSKSKNFDLFYSFETEKFTEWLDSLNLSQSTINTLSSNIHSGYELYLLVNCSKIEDFTKDIFESNIIHAALNALIIDYCKRLFII